LSLFFEGIDKGYGGFGSKLFKDKIWKGLEYSINKKYNLFPIIVILNGVEYYYIRDAQGDIIGLFNSSGKQVVSYTYDSWGKPVVTDTEKNDVNDTVKDGITGSLASTVGVKNPYRYRVYRYDAEMGLYYLNSRYYNPEWGSMLNADALGGKVGELLSHNVFAYCKNNPINMCDPSGFMGVYVMDDAGSYSVGWDEIWLLEGVIVKSLMVILKFIKNLSIFCTI